MQKSFNERTELQKRIRTTLKHFDGILKPLHDVIRAHSGKVRDHAEKGVMYISELTMDCIRTVENYCFQLMLFTMEYIFTDNDYRFNFKGTRTYKMLVVLFMERLKKVFHSNPEALRLMQKMEHMRTDDVSDDEEGFFGSSEDEEKQVTSSIFMKNVRYNDLMKDPAFRSEKVIRLLQERDDQIKQLQFKLTQRERNLTEITAGYLKDLQNMRDQMFRRNNSEDIDYYEVQYFDISEIEDPLYLNLVNNKIADLKSQYEKKTRDLIAKIETQKSDIGNLNFQVQSLQYKTQNLNNPEYLVHKVFSLEKNAYRLWKMIQDCKGNDFFFEVFEKQKSTYGINYREINKLLMHSKAYDREFEYYKRGIEDQMYSYLERAIQAINDAQSANAELELSNQVLMDQLGQQQAEQQQALLERINQSLIDWKRNTLNVRSYEIKQVKQAFQIWALKARLEKTLDKNSLEKWVYQLTTSTFTGAKASDLESDLLAAQEALKEQIVQSELVRARGEETAGQMMLLKGELSSVKKQLLLEKTTVKDLTARLGNIEKCNFQILRHLDPKTMQATTDAINLDDDRRESTKSFKERIKLLDVQGRRFIAEVTEQLHRSTLGLRVLTHVPVQRDQATLTSIFNVRKELDHAYVAYKQSLSSQENDPDSQVREINGWETNKENSSQTLLKGDDIEELEKHNQELIDRVSTLQDEVSSKPIMKVDQTPTRYQPQGQRNVSNNTSKPTSQQPHTAAERRKLQLIVTDREFLEDHASDSQPDEPQNALLMSAVKPRDQSLPGIESMKYQINPATYQSHSSDREGQPKNSGTVPRSQKGVFSRLFDDSKSKQKRIDDLKQKLALLEEQQWTDMLQIMNYGNNQEGVSQLEEQMVQNKRFYQDQLQQNAKMQDRLTPKAAQPTQQSAEMLPPELPETPSKVLMLQKTRAEFYFNRYKEYHLPKNPAPRPVQPQELFFHLNQENYIQSQRKYIKNMIQTAKNRETFQRRTSNHERSTQPSPTNIAQFNKKRIRIMLSS